MHSPSLVWFRNDLRIADNSALWHARQQGPVVGYYQIAQSQWQRHHMADCRVAFLLRTLGCLRQQLNRLGIPLVVEQVPEFVDAPRSLLKMTGSWQCRQVFWNDEYPIDEKCRDNACEQALEAVGITVSRYQDALIAAPGSITRRAGGPFQVFTPFKRAWLEHFYHAVPQLLPEPAGQSAIKGDQGVIPQRLNGINADLHTALWPAGELEAAQRLHKFATTALHDYDQQRDFPAHHGTSTLSPYLAVGAISARQCLYSCLEANGGELTSGDKGAQAWLNELIWRDFYQHIVVAFPEVCKNRPFKPVAEQVAWRNSGTDFQRWCDGQTGVPIVDAGMRQLRQTGWMHNRVRMIVAMFLSKNLLLDWRWGERFFMEQLIDGDFTANNGGWQWSASTGTDAVPYFRIFNPFTQASRFDPEAEYIHRFVPELAKLDAQLLHDPKRLAAHRPDDYPPLMVDLAASRQRAIAAFKEAASY